MNDLTKLYHWTNIILNPTLLILIFAAQSDYAMITAMGWALITAVLNEKIRSWVFGFFATLTGASIVVAALASAVGLFVLIFAAGIFGTVGFFVILAYTWVTSLKAVVDAQRGLI